MGKRGDRSPRAKSLPRDRQVKTASNPENFNKQKIAWSSHLIDLEGRWGWKRVSPECWWEEILPKMQQLESMTWAEILQASGGRTHGNNSHAIPIEKLDRDARDHLAAIHQDDIDEVFSLRLQGKHRVFGIKDGRVLKVLWFDERHEICPIK